MFTKCYFSQNMKPEPNIILQYIHIFVWFKVHFTFVFLYSVRFCGFTLWSKSKNTLSFYTISAILYIFWTCIPHLHGTENGLRSAKYNEIISPSSSTIKVFLEIFPWQTIEFGIMVDIIIKKIYIIVGFTIVWIFQKHKKKWN